MKYSSIIIKKFSLSAYICANLSSKGIIRDLRFIAAFILLFFLSSAVYAQEFTAKTIGDYGNVTVMEVTGNYDSHTPDGSVNDAPRQAIAKEFFKTHKDEYDFLVIFSNFDFHMPDDGKAKAFYSGIKNDIQGIGIETFDNTSFYGSNGRLQGIVDMGNLSGLATDSLDPKFEDTLYILSHELMHRWGAYVKFKDLSGNISTALLGKDSNHWSFLLDSGGSVMYGNRWQDNGNGTFTSLLPQSETKFYSPLDLYLMGMIDKSQVPAMLLIENPSIDPTRLPEAGVTISGTARYISIEDIIAAEGERVPGSAQSQKSFKTAFIFITSPGTFKGDEIYAIENIRNGWVTRHSVLTDGQSIVEVASTPKEDVPTKPGFLPPPTTPRTLPPDINDGVRWLMNSQQSDGSWNDLTQTVERDTAEVTLVLRNFDTARTNYQTGLLWLGSASSGNIDFLSRKIETLSGEGQDVSALIQELISKQNSDGGWGSENIYFSDVADTGLVLKALAVAGYTDQSVISKAIQYLVSAQKSDGGWTGNGESTIQATAHALMAFSEYGRDYQLSDSVNRGVQWLLTKQNTDGGFGNSPSTVYDTAMAVMALRELNASTDITNRGLEYILAAQDQDGSWNKSAYETALAVHAVYAATVDPDMSIKNADITFIPSTVTQLPSNIVINANIWNTGRTSVSQAKVALYENSVSDANKLAEQTVAFPGQQSTTVTFSVTITDGNEHRYYIVVDPDNLVKESSEANNSAVSVIRPEATYDFEVLASDITISPNPIDMFQDVKITAKIANKGTMNAYNVQVKYFIYDTVNTYELGTLTMDIPANTTVTKEITWRANKAGTNLPVTVQADPFDNFAELSETNNKASARLTVNSVNLTDPNLTVSYRDIFITPAPALERGNVNISALVKNDGFSAASNVVVSFYRGVPSPNSLLIGTQTIPSLAPNESARVSIDWTNIPESGEKIIYIQVDPANQIHEIKEDDNDTFTTLNVLSLPDLAVSTNSIVFSPSAPKDGDTVTISVTVQNSGEQSASNILVSAYDGSANIGKQTITALSGNAQSSASFIYDTTEKTGAHQITVTVDPDNSIPELSEYNNSASRTLGVQNANLWLTEQYISPNGDGVKDSTQFFFRLDTPQTVKIEIVNSKSEIVRTFTGPEFENTSGMMITWDGLNDKGMVVADGRYEIRIIDASGNIIGGLAVTIDNNRSPLTDAIGTKYLLHNNLTCLLPDVGQKWQWLPDESGIIVNVPYTPEYPNGLYSISPDGVDILRLVPMAWSQGLDPTYDYYYFGHELSPDGEKVAFILNKYNKKTWAYELSQIWVVDRDGTNLTLLDTIAEGQINRIYDVKWSPRGDFIVYRTYIYKYPPGSVEALRVIKADGTGKTIIDSGGYYDFNYVAWSPDGSHIAYVYGSYVDRNYIEKIRVSDLIGNKQQVFSDIREVDYTFINYLTWLNQNKLILSVFGLDGRTIWLVDPSGNNNNNIIVGKNDFYRSIIWPAPSGRLFAFIPEGASGIVISDSEGNTYARNARTGGAFCTPDLSDPAWSPDGQLLAFSERLVTCGNCPGQCTDPYGPHVIVANATTHEEISFANSMYLLAWFSDGISLIGSGSEDISFINVRSGETKSLSLPAGASMWLNDKARFISPREHYISYYQSVDSSSPCYGKGEIDLWLMGSLLNLTADVRAVKQKSAVILKGIAADRNFEGYKLEYADIKNPAIWYPVAPPSDIPVMNDVFTTWVSPYKGTFSVRLTAWDKAGNIATSTRRVSWGLSSSIINVYKSLEIFSPNGDGVKDTLELHYRVLEPVHLEFFIYDADNNLVATIYKDHAATGEYFISWDGSDNSHNIVPDGKYKIKIFNFEFFVEIDTAPPDVHVALSSINIFEAKFCPPDRTEYVSFDREMGKNLLAVDLQGRAIDKNQKSWIIEIGEGYNPQHWLYYLSGVKLFTLDQNGSPVAGQDVVIKTFYQGNVNKMDTSGSGESTNLVCVVNKKTEIEWLVGKKFRITAEDFAGNKSTFTSDFLEERILLLSWDLVGSVLNDGEDNFLIRVPYNFAEAGLHVLRGQETVRQQIESVNVQYNYAHFNTDLQKYEWTEWIDGPMVHDAVNETEPWKITLPWDNSSVWNNLSMEERSFLVVRMKGVDISGREYYSNLLTFDDIPPQDNLSTFTVAFTLDVDYKEAECGQLSSRVELASALHIRGKGNASLKTLSYYIQKDGVFHLIRQIDLSRENWGSAVIDTTNMAEGSYPVRAVLVYFDLDNNIFVETSANNTLIVDHSLPDVRITYPTKTLRLCPLKISDSSGDWNGVPVEVSATDNTSVKRYELLYSIGENTTSWLPVTTRLDGNKVSLSGKGPLQGQIGPWDVTYLNGNTFSLRLNAIDVAGNASCVTTSFSIDDLTEITRLAMDKMVFSPNGDAILDDVMINYQIDEYATVGANAYKLVKTADGSEILDSMPVRTIASGVSHLSGSGNIIWDGKADSGVAVPDGRYGVVIYTADSCGNTTQKWAVVEVDNYKPAVTISYPHLGDSFGNIVEVKGTADDLHFQSYTLEAGEGDGSSGWLLISTNTMPVKNGVLGTWNTFGLSDGVWTLRLTAYDMAGNKVVTTSVVNLNARKTLIKALDVAPTLFSPNNDGKLDVTNINYEITDVAEIRLDILDTDGTTVRTHAASKLSPDAYTFSFDGKNAAGTVIPDGTYSVRITATLASDPAVAQTETISLTVDTTPPLVDIKDPADNAYLKADGTVNGTINDLNMQGYAVTFASSAGTVFLDQGNQSRSNYVFGSLKDLPEGTYTLTAWAKDIGENETTKNIAFTVDRTPPVVKFDTPKDGEYYGTITPAVDSQQSPNPQGGTGQAGVISITASIVEKNIETFILRYGSGDNPTQWTELLTGNAVPTNPQIFIWKVGKNDGVPDGTYILSLFAKDKAGSEAEARVKVTVDNTLPEAVISSPAEGEYVKGPVDVKGTAFDQNLDKYTIEISEGGCDSAYKWAPLWTSAVSVQNGILAKWQALPPDGEYCLRLTTTDKLGSRAEAKVSVKVDAHPPAAPVLAGQVENKINAQITWNGNNETDIAGYNIYRAGNKINTGLVAGSEFRDQNLSEGYYAYTVKAVDLAGWESQASNEVKLKIDLTGPDARIRSPQDGGRVSGLIDIKGTAYSTDDFKQYRLFIGQGDNPTTWVLIRTSPLPISYGLLAQWDTLGLAEGQVYTLKLEVEDISGNISTHQIAVTIDNTPPERPVILAATASNSDVTVTWNANAEADLAGYLLYRNDQVANVSGIVMGDLKPYLVTGTTYLDKSLSDGMYKYYVVAMDHAGNMSDPSDIREAVIDTHAPHAVITEPADKTMFDQKLLVKAESQDLDIAQIQFQYKKATDSDWTNLGAPVSSQPFVTYLDPAILAGYGDYYLRAVATDKGNKADPTPSSITVTFADITAPPVPSGITAHTHGRDVTITWTAASDTDTVGYNVYRTSGSTRVRINQAPVPKQKIMYLDTGLADGVYIYDVTSVDAYNNESKPSNSSSAKVYAPMLVQPYTPTGQNTIHMSGSNAGPNTTVEIFVENAGLIATTTADPAGNFAADVVLITGENRLTARSTDSEGNISRTSDMVVVVYNDPPAAPTGLTAYVHGYDVSLTWNPNAESDLAGYNLYREGEKVNLLQPIAQGDITASYSDDYDLPSLAFDSDPSTSWIGPYGYGGFEPVVWWELRLPSPELINHIEINWGSEIYSGEELLYAGKDYEIQVWSGYAWITQAKVAGNTFRVNTFDFKPSYRTDKIRIYVTEGVNPDNIKQIWISEIKILGDKLIVAPQYNDMGLKDKEYNYTVTAVDYYGFESLPSNGTKADVGDVVPPAAPQNLTVVANGSNIVLNWSASPEPDLAGYHIYRNTEQGWLRINKLLITADSYSDMNLPNGIYTYRVTAVDAVGNESLPSSEASVTVSVSLPVPPVNLQVSPMPEGGALKISWGYPDGAPAGYNLYRGLSHGGPYARINASIVTDLSYADTGLTDGTAYYYIVTAVDSAGNESTYSSEAIGIPADTVAPEKPAILFPTVSDAPITVYERMTDVTGSAESGSSVSLFNQGVLVGTTSVLAQDAVESVPVEGGAYDVVLSPDRKKLAYSANNALWLKDVASGTAVKIADYGKAPAWSPDGGRIAYRYTKGYYERIAIYERKSGNIYDITSDSNAYEPGTPSWSGDGNRIAFISRRAGPWDVWVKDFVTGSLIQATKNSYWDYPLNPRISPDGKKVAYFNGSGLYVADIVNNNTVQIDSHTDRFSLDWSPDGEYVAYISIRDGKPDIFVVNVDTGDGIQVTESPEQEALLAWSPDGKDIVFGRTENDNTNKLWVAGIQQDKPVRSLQSGLYDLRYLDWLNSGSIVLLSRNGLGIVYPQGYFEFKDVALNEGENLYHAISTDSAGNVSEQSDPVTVIFDTSMLPDLATSPDDIYIYPVYPLVGQDVAINAVVWNRGQVDVKDVDVDLYIWDASGKLLLLKSERIPFIAAESGEIVEAYWNTGSNIGVNTIIAVVDPEDNIKELMESNNLAMREITVVENEDILMTTTLDSASYQAGQKVNVRINLKNPGMEKDVTVSVAIEDENGYTVTTFDPRALRLAYATERDVLFTWNTGTTYAGPYRIHVVLTGSGILAENLVPFEIVPDLAIDSTLTTNRLSYGPGEDVGIFLTVSHRGTNSFIPALTARVRITDSQETVIFGQEKSITNILPGAMVTLNFSWNTGVTLPGVYTVSSELILNGQTISAKSISFTINAVAAISGSITAAPSVVPFGQALDIGCSMENSGNADARNVLMSVLIIDPVTQDVVDQYQDMVEVTVGSSFARQIVFTTSNYGLKSYIAVLRYSHTGITKTLASASFTVKDMAPPVVTIISPVSCTTYNTTIPISATVTDNASGVGRVEYQTDSGIWKPLPVADPSSGSYTTAWEPTIADNGSHTINFRATDKAGNTTMPVSVSFEIQMDSESPITGITIGGPKREADGKLYVSGSTAFTLSAVDNFSGILKTEYRIDDGQWIVYAGAFVLLSYGDGEHSIFYRSTDNAGNAENPRELKLILDKTPPVTTITASDPLTEGQVNTVSPVTFFTLTATDDLSGVMATKYRIDDGTWQSYTGSFSLAGLSPGQHTLAYKSIDNVLNEETEKSISVRLIVLDVSKKVSSDPVVLVGAWKYKGHDDDKEDRHEESRSDENGKDKQTVGTKTKDETEKDDDREDHKKDAQAALSRLTEILSSAGIGYTIPESEDDFETIFRSGRYTTYILLDFKEKDIAKELREAVHYGDGLIFIKTRPEDDPHLGDVFGVRFTGRTAGKDHTVQLKDSPISNEGTIETSGKIVKLALTGQTAQGIGYVTDRDKTYPAIVSNQYGRGRTILYAFDLLSAPDQAQAAALLINSINHVQPLEHYPRPLDSVPIRIWVKNSAESVNINVIETIPSNTSADTIAPEATLSENTITWLKPLAADEKTAFRYYLNLPDQAGDYRTETEVRFSNLGEYLPYGKYYLTLSVRYSSTELLQSAIRDLEAMLGALKPAPTPDGEDDDREEDDIEDADDYRGHDAEKIKGAINALRKVKTSASDRKGAEKNIERILKAIRKVRRLSNDATQLRLKLDELLKVWEKKWYMMDSEN